jgi:Flagellar filament outer layer protein Flaa.
MKKRISALLVCVGLLLAVFNFGIQKPVFAANMLSNGGFESGLWAERSGSWILDTTAYYEGVKSAKIIGTTAEQYMSTELVSVNRFDTYRITVWIKTDAISAANVVSISALEVDASNNAVGWNGGSNKLVATGGTQNWTQYTATLSGLNALTAKLKVYCRIDANVTGTAWFDGVSLDTVNKVPNFSFESGLWAERSGGTIDTTVKNGGVQSAKIVGGSTEQYMASSLLSIGFDDKYELSVWIKTSSISTTDGVSINLLQVDASNNAIGWYGNYKLIATGSTQNWTKYTVDNIGDFAAGTASIKIYLRVDASITGTAWFDDVVLKQKLRDNFLWGITGHQKGYASYPEAQLSNQIQKVVGLGANIYRINYTPPYTNGVYDWTYLDNVVNTCYNNKIKMLLVIYDSAGVGQTTTYLHDRAKDIATRYKGKIAYYQIANEQDNACILPGLAGMVTTDYDTTTYATIRDNISAMCNGIYEGDPCAKRVINISWKHYGFLQLLTNDGVSWDVNGDDWYWDINDMVTNLNTIATNFTQPEILICESNIWKGTYDNTEQQQSDYIKSFIKALYYNTSSKVKGYIGYELLDEPVITDTYYMDNFEGTAFNWTVDSTYATGSTFVQSAVQKYEGSYSGRLNYNFNTASNNYVVLTKEQPLYGQQTHIKMWVYGDNSGNILHIRFKDSTGELFQSTYGAINWTGWQLVTINFLTSPQSLGGGDNDGIVDYTDSENYGDTFESIVLDDPTDSYIGSGTIYFDYVVYDYIIVNEAHFGLVNCDRYGNIGANKLAYSAMYDAVMAKN